jgi:diaminohydroxyphosphoribosylaminopyrimidine deaminase/5-amino-6-(5-phosphoribosylamino)uracil reductase
MTDTDERLMNEAISLAQQCNPIAAYFPRVGAIVAVNGVTVRKGHRGTGRPGDDDHAEKVAIDGVVEKQELPRATIYTTLEPCTPEVRSDPSKCCTELVAQHKINTVFIGILDPNQGVRGKGLWELQNRGVRVKLFPPEFADRVRAINAEFIRVQQTYGIHITSPKPGETVRTYDKGGVCELKGTFLNQPGPDVFAFIGNGGQWWPQPHSLCVTGKGTWSMKTYFGSYGPQTIWIVKANQLAIDLVKYYEKVRDLNIERERKAKQFFDSNQKDGTAILEMLKNKYIGIEMGALPKGIEVLAMVDIIVESPPTTR